MLTELNKYLVKLDSFDTDIIDIEIKRNGLDHFFNLYIYRYLDATRYNGSYRPIQTIGYGYRKDISRVLFVLDNYDVSEESKEKWIKALYDVHMKNLEFENEYPPIVYSKKVTKPVIKKETKETKEDEEDKITVIKSKLKVDRLSKLKFKFS